LRAGRRTPRLVGIDAPEVGLAGRSVTESVLIFS
jgi:hypothetical protein